MTFKVDPKDHPLTITVSSAIDQLVDKITGVDLLGDIAGELTEYTVEHTRDYALAAIEHIRDHLRKHEAKLIIAVDKCDTPCSTCLTDSSCCD
jgi:hypothetical protein